MPPQNSTNNTETSSFTMALLKSHHHHHHHHHRNTEYRQREEEEEEEGVAEGEYTEIPSASSSYPSSSSPSKTNTNTSSTSLWTSLRREPRLAGYCLALTSVILLWGYDLAMTGNIGSLDAFKRDFGIPSPEEQEQEQESKEEEQYILPSPWLSAWNTGSPIGIALGSLLSGSLQDRLGRRKTLAIGSFTSALGVGVVLLATYLSSPSQLISRRGLYLVGKIIQGITIGTAASCTQTYMSEILLPVKELKAPLMALIPVFYLLGQLVSAVVMMLAAEGGNYEGEMSYRICIISEWPFSVVPVLVAFIMPESPVWLLRKGGRGAREGEEEGEAWKCQRRFDSREGKTDERIRELRALVEHEKMEAESEGASYRDCLRGVDGRRTAVVVFAACMPQLFGLPIMGDGAYFLQIAGIESTTSFIFLIACIVAGMLGMVGNLFYISSRVGRRRIVLVSMGIIGIFWAGVGIAGCFGGVNAAWSVGVLIDIAALVAGLGVWPTSYVIGGEASSLRLRAKTQGIGWALGGVSNLVFSIITPYLYNTDAGNLRAKVGLVWAGVCVLTVVGIWFVIPEMKGRSPLELDIMFEHGVPANDFKRWEADVEDGVAASTDDGKTT